MRVERAVQYLLFSVDEEERSISSFPTVKEERSRSCSVDEEGSNTVSTMNGEDSSIPSLFYGLLAASERQFCCVSTVLLCFDCSIALWLLFVVF